MIKAEGRGLILNLDQKLSFQKISVIALCLYIMTLFVFVHDSRYVFISEGLFLVFGTATLLHVMKIKRIKMSIFYINAGLLLLLSVSSILWANEQSLAMSSVKTIFQLFLLLILVFLSVDSKEDIAMCMKSFFIGGVLMSAYSFLYYGSDEIMDALKSGYRLGGDINQENIFGYLSALTVVFGIYYALSLRQIRYVLLSILPFIFVIGSGSRRSILILLFGILALFLISGITGRSRLMVILKLLLAIWLIDFILEQVIYLDVFSRLEPLVKWYGFSGKESNSLNTRYRMIVFGLELFKEHPLVGVGVNQYRSWFNEAYGNYRPAHNGYIQTLADLGLVGFFLYYGMFSYMWIKLWAWIRKNKAKLEITAIVFVILSLHLLSDIATNSFYDKITYIILGLAFACLEHTRGENFSIKGEDS